MLIEGNHLHDNTAGIAITLMPGLPVKDAARTHIRQNFIVNNNLKNFAPSSSVAAGVPQGLGVLLLR